VCVTCIRGCLIFVDKRARACGGGIGIRKSPHTPPFAIHTSTPPSKNHAHRYSRSAGRSKAPSPSMYNSAKTQPSENRSMASVSGGCWRLLLRLLLPWCGRWAAVPAWGLVRGGEGWWCTCIIGIVVCVSLFVEIECGGGRVGGREAGVRVVVVVVMVVVGVVVMMVVDAVQVCIHTPHTHTRANTNTHTHVHTPSSSSCPPRRHPTLPAARAGAPGPCLKKHEHTKTIT
jgi:hypothetical protein